MPDYRRAWTKGGRFFFTVNLWQRKNQTLLIDQIDDLRRAVRDVRLRHPFDIDAWVVLPDHLHCVMTLPPDDIDFALRWRLIKANFSRAIRDGESRSPSRKRRGERGIWQRRFWEHQIRDEHDFRAHVDYVHINPVKHGHVQRVADWPYSTFHDHVRRGIYPVDWTGGDAGLDYPD